jgi:hypothetical protein
MIRAADCTPYARRHMLSECPQGKKSRPQMCRTHATRSLACVSFSSYCQRDVCSPGLKFVYQSRTPLVPLIGQE